MLIGLINYGSGNFSSVRNALKFLDLNVIEISSPEGFESVSHIILPGVGAFASAMKKIENMGLIEPMKRQVLIEKKPFLGICVGMQLLGEYGLEFVKYNGFGFINGYTDILNVIKRDLPLPHVGWNEIEICDPEMALFKKMGPKPVFYFIHSYCLRKVNKDSIAAYCTYGEKFVAVICKENIYGVQFHPEKSQHEGLKLLKNFSEIKQ